MVQPLASSGTPRLSVEEFDRRMHAALVERIGQARYELWFPERVRFRQEENGIQVGVANLILQSVIQRQFGDLIRAAALSLTGLTSVDLHFRIDPELFRAIRAQQAEAEQNSPKARSTPPPASPTPDLFQSQAPRSRQPAPAKRRWKHLHDFVVGPCNRVAFAAAQSVVEEPAQGPNPLILHGPVGTGKTHLLEGVYAGLRRKHPHLKVLYIGAEDFTNRFVTAVRFGKQNAFRKSMRGCDVLLLDDLHFLARKKATQEEFLHTFDACLSDGKQVVLTCDCHPRLNDDFSPELMDRLLGGAIWSLLPPDPETRLALLRLKANGPGRRGGASGDTSAGSARSSIPEEVLQFLAERLRGNVRELEGALHSLRHYSQVTRRSIDIDLAREALGDLLRHAVRVVRLADVDAVVCRVLRLPTGALQSKQRSWSVSHPRMLAIYLARKHTAASYGEISAHFAGRSHSTAVAAEKKVRHWLQNDERLAIGGGEWSVRDLLERIERELLG